MKVKEQNDELALKWKEIRRRVSLILSTREPGKATLRGMSVPPALPKRCSFSCKYLIFQLNEDTFSNVHIKFYKMVYDYSLLVIVCHIQSISSMQKSKHLPLGRIFWWWFSHESEEQTPRMVGADDLAVLGVRRESLSDVSSFKVGILEQRGHTL